MQDNSNAIVVNRNYAKVSKRSVLKNRGARPSAFLTAVGRFGSGFLNAKNELLFGVDPLAAASRRRYVD
jgi:hypothetical protein